MKKLTRKNPNDIYLLWLDLSSKDKSKARKAALALKSQLSSKKSLSDFWPIIREERDLTVDEIKAKIESVIKKTSGARVNPVKKLIRKNSKNNFREILNQKVTYEVLVDNPPWGTLLGILKHEGNDVFRVYDPKKDDGVEFTAADVNKISFDKIFLNFDSSDEAKLACETKRKNPQTSLGFFPFETNYSPNQIESLIIYADEINGLKEKGKFVAADKKLQKLENSCGKRLAEKVVAWRKYNKY